MSWNKIKTFLIILFALINCYLIFTTGGIELLFPGAVSNLDDTTINNTISVINKNYGIDVSYDLIPEKLRCLNNIDVTNLIYTDISKKSGYEIFTDNSEFSFSVNTDTYSYNEENAKKEFVTILSKLGVDNDSYSLDLSKNDSGLVCRIYGLVDNYPIFNNYIEASFTSRNIDVHGTWYKTDTKKIEFADSGVKMQPVTGSLIDAARRAGSNAEKVTHSVSNIDYGYFVSYYDENAVSKSASAIPCYMIETDSGLKYYYDVSNGILLKQEE